MGLGIGKNFSSSGHKAWPEPRMQPQGRSRGGGGGTARRVKFGGRQLTALRVGSKQRLAGGDQPCGLASQAADHVDSHVLLDFGFPLHTCQKFERGAFYLKMHSFWGPTHLEVDSGRARPAGSSNMASSTSSIGMATARATASPLQMGPSTRLWVGRLQNDWACWVSLGFVELPWVSLACLGFARISFAFGLLSLLLNQFNNHLGLAHWSATRLGARLTPASQA